ncbi:hypothetical protein D0A37_16300 [Microcoleus vaginatus HSN003]|nr:hypothetical protein D0A37_16300 [Microcoleus vaginatus HSN003]
MRTKIFTTNLFNCDRDGGHDMTNLATAKTVKAFLILETITITTSFLLFLLPSAIAILAEVVIFLPYPNPPRTRREKVRNSQMMRGLLSN